MPNRNFSDISQKQWIRACKKLGLVVDTRSGKGSHVLIKHPEAGHRYTLQKSLHKFINMKIFKKLLEWGFDEEAIWEALN